MPTPTDPLTAPPMSDPLPPQQVNYPAMSDPLPPQQEQTAVDPTVPASPNDSFLTPTAATSPGFPATQPVVTPTFDLAAAGGDTGFASQVPASGLPVDLSTPKAPGETYPDFLPKEPTDMPAPTSWDVTSEQTVAGQFASIMDSDNPVFKIVQEQILRQHAAQGGQNSLMAARSAAMAVADVGFKIAAQDAATFARSAEFNAAMSNQFGLAEQQFLHNAMLSEQNFNQGVLMLREQHMANLDQINADLASRMRLMGLEANINLQLEGFRQTNILQQIDSNFRNNMETMQAQFEYNWETAEQAQGQALERMDRETSNELYRNEAQFSWQQQLNYLSEVGQNSRMLLNAIGQIGSNPNITAAQASAAVQDVLRQYNAVNEQLAAVYSVPSVGGMATNYLDYSSHNLGYTTGTTTSPTPTIPFYGTPTDPAAPTSPTPTAPTTPTDPVAPAPTTPPPPAPTPPPEEPTVTPIPVDTTTPTTTETENPPILKPDGSYATYNPTLRQYVS